MAVRCDLEAGVVIIERACPYLVTREQVKTVSKIAAAVTGLANVELTQLPRDRQVSGYGGFGLAKRAAFEFRKVLGHLLRPRTRRSLRSRLRGQPSQDARVATLACLP